jgi:hypothetical protein
MRTTQIAIWVTIATEGDDIDANLDEAVAVVSAVASQIPRLDKRVVDASAGDEAIVIDENGDELFNGEY